MLTPTLAPHSLSSGAVRALLGQDPEHMADAGTVLPSSVLDTPKNDRGGNRSFTHLTRQEKDYKRLRVLITEIDGEGVTGTGIARESLRHKDRPILGETGVARDTQ